MHIPLLSYFTQLHTTCPLHSSLFPWPGAWYNFIHSLSIIPSARIIIPNYTHPIKMPIKPISALGAPWYVCMDVCKYRLSLSPSLIQSTYTLPYSWISWIYVDLQYLFRGSVNVKIGHFEYVAGMIGCLGVTMIGISAYDWVLRGNDYWY